MYLYQNHVTSILYIIGYTTCDLMYRSDCVHLSMFKARKCLSILTFIGYEIEKYLIVESR